MAKTNRIPSEILEEVDSKLVQALGVCRITRVSCEADVVDARDHADALWAACALLENARTELALVQKDILAKATERIIETSRV